MKKLLLLLSVLFAVGSISSAKDANRQGKDRVVVAYVTAGSNEVPDPTVMTHINYAFGNVNETFDGVNIQNPNRLRMIVGLKQQNPRLKVLLSIGGWTSGRFSEMASTKDTRQRFARDCRRIVDDFELDGIDMDWEYPSSSEAGISSSPNDIDNFTLLMQVLRKELGPDKLLTAATICTAKYIDFGKCLQYMDLVNVMSYDMSNPDKQHHAALYPSPISGYCTCSQAVEAHLKAGVPKEKLVMGMPFYAKGRRKDPGVVEFLRTGTLPKDYRHCWSNEAQADYIANDKGEFVWAFETPRSLRAKCQYIIDNDLRGGMYWDYVSDKTGEFRTVVCEMLLQRRTDKILTALHNPATEYVAVAAHRGDWRNYPENSLPAIESVIRMGVDIMELDLKKTKDGVLVVCHDATLDRTTTGSGYISDYTYEELLKFDLKRGHGIAIPGMKIPTLRQALAICKDRIVVNVDQGFDYYDEVLAITEELGMTDQILIKSNLTRQEVIKKMGTNPQMMYMPVISVSANASKRAFESFICAQSTSKDSSLDTHLQPIAFELCFDKLDNSVHQAASQVRAAGRKVWVNTIWGSLCGDYDDDRAFDSQDADEVYAPILALGTSIIQTDRPEFLIAYLQKKGRR